MTRTNVALLALWAIAAGVVMWALQVWITATGAPTIVPSVPFGVTLLLVAVAAVVIAWPVRRYTRALRAAVEADAQNTDAGAGADARREDARWREVARRRVDPGRATLALALAKASSLAGSIFAGACGATVLWLTSRTVVGAGVPTSVFSLVCAVVLIVAGLVAESWCALPPDDADRDAVAA